MICKKVSNVPTGMRKYSCLLIKHSIGITHNQRLSTFVLNFEYFK